MRLLLLRCQAVPTASFFGDYLAGILHAARELGHATRVFEYAHIGTSPPAERDALYRLLASFQPDAVIDPCCWGYALSASRVWDGSGEGERVFDSVGAAYVGLLCDQPYHQPVPGMHSQRLRIAAPDQTHGEQMDMIWPRLVTDSTVFVPPAARPENDRSLPAGERDIDLLYMGNLQHDALARPWRGSPEEQACDQLADLALQQPDVPLHRTLAQWLQRDGLDIPGGELTLWLQRVEYFLRARFRHDAVRAAADAGLRMHVVGRGWDTLALPGNVTLQEEVSYEDFFRLCGRSRAALDASTYLNGANDRVFNFAVNRCMVFTNAGGYLEPAFGGIGLRCYSMQALPALGPLLHETLSDTHRLLEETEAAHDLVLQSHTWRRRLPVMLQGLAEGS